MHGLNSNGFTPHFNLDNPLVALGSIGFVLQSFCFFSSLRLISGPLATVLLYLYPAFVVCLLFFKGRRIGLYKVIALSVALLGSILVIDPLLQEGTQNISGVLLAIGAAVVYALYVVIGETVLSKEQAVPSVATMSAAAATVYALVGVVQGFRLPTTTESWIALVCIGVVCAAMAIGLLFQSIKLIGSANAAILSTSEPVVTAIIAVSLMGETLTTGKVLGGVLILLAAIVLMRQEC